MSEYQYYEFQAIDRPLDDKAMTALGNISSPPEITPTSMTNVYNYGDFRGNPDRLMDQYFDAHLYIANWGNRRLMLRLPLKAFDEAAAKPYLLDEILDVRPTENHVIFDFDLNPEDGGGEWVEGEGLLAPMLPLRYDLLGGDLRCLYLGWLIGVDLYHLEEDELEPPVPPGLHKLSRALEEFADFFELDEDLIEVAARTSAKDVPGDPGDKELAHWVAQLPLAEKNALLVRLMQGDSGMGLSGELLNRFRKDHALKQAKAGGGGVALPRRTVKELRVARDGLEVEKKQEAAKKAAKEKAKRDAEQAEARSRHLDSLVGREEELWRQADEAAAKKLPKEYDRAVELLKDLIDLAVKKGTIEAAKVRLDKLRQRHSSKRTFLQRLDKVGLGDEDNT